MTALFKDAVLSADEDALLGGAAENGSRGTPGTYSIIIGETIIAFAGAIVLSGAAGGTRCAQNTLVVGEVVAGLANAGAETVVVGVAGADYWSGWRARRGSVGGSS